MKRCDESAHSETKKKEKRNIEVYSKCFLFLFGNNSLLMVKQNQTDTGSNVGAKKDNFHCFIP